VIALGLDPTTHLRKAVVSGRVLSAYRQLGIYAAKILNGTKPANLHTIAGWQAQKGTQRTEQIRAPLD